MKIQITTSFDDTENPVRLENYLVVLDTQDLCLMGSEQPIDLIMEILSTEKAIRGPRHIIEPIRNVQADGYATLRAAIAPGSCRLIKISEYLEVDAQHRISARFVQRHKDWGPDAWISLDGGKEMSLAWREFQQSPDRSATPSNDIFGDAYASTYSSEVRQDQHTAGSVLTGFCKGIFEKETSVARSELSAGQAILVCAMAALSGIKFSEYSNRDHIEWAVSAGSEQYKNFIRNGHLVSERGWNPTSFLAGPRLAEAIEAADPEPCSLGQSFCSEVRDLDDTAARLALLTLLEEADYSVSQVHSYIKLEIPKDESSHARLMRTGTAQRLTQIIQKMASA